ncbi:MAG: sarcosine oxidase subunit gamma family protein [Stappiaceae bacterium]
MTDEFSFTNANGAQTPLADISDTLLAATCRKVALREAPLASQITLRAKSDNADFFHAVQRQTGLELPRLANNFVEDDARRLFWMGPSEWFLTAPDGEAPRIVKELELATEGQHVSVVDVSDNRTCLTLSGAKSWNVLNKTCAFDLHPRTFEPGQCAQTLVGRTQVLLAMTADNQPEFQLYVRNSFAHYLAGFLLEAMREYYE